MENKNSIKEMLEKALQDTRAFTDANTTLGDPLCLDNGITVIPVSKISVGFASGGLDLPASEFDGKKNFGGGGGTGVSIAPIGFLTIYPDGRAEMIPVMPTEMGPLDQIADVINRAPEIIGRIRSAIAGDDDAGDEEITELTFDANGDAKKSKKKKRG